MSGTAVGKTPANDAEWARDTQRRVEAVENPESTRVGAWVLSTSASGALIASHVDGGSVTLAIPPETVDDPDEVSESVLPILKMSTSTEQVGVVAFESIDVQLGDWGASSGANVLNVPVSGVYMIIGAVVWKTTSGSRRYGYVRIDGARVMSFDNAANGESQSSTRSNVYLPGVFSLTAGQGVSLEGAPTNSGIGGAFIAPIGSSNDDTSVITSLSLICLARG